MGLLIAQMRKAQLNSQRSDLEYKIQLIQNAKLDLTNQVNDYLMASTGMPVGSEELKTLEQKKEQLHLMEKRLDQILQQLQQQLQMINAEEQGLEQQIQEGIKRQYSA